MIFTRMSVREYAVGSLLPDSSSSIGSRFSRRDRRLLRRTEKTEGESVEDNTAATRKQPSSDFPASPIWSPRTKRAKRPVVSTVTARPTVESMSPLPITGRVSFREVSRPPDRRMIVMPRWPRNSASSWSAISTPSPSGPASIPMIRNRSIPGTPYFAPSREMMMAKRTSTDRSRRMFPVPRWMAMAGTTESMRRFYLRIGISFSRNSGMGRLVSRSTMRVLMPA